MIGLLLLPSLARADILVDPDPATETEVVVTVLDDLSRPISGATVRAIHRPGLPGERDLAVGLTDARGRVYWTPAEAGTTVLRTRGESQVVHVARPAPPPTPLVVLSALGVVGLGLAGWGLWPRRRREDPDQSQT
jgi:hypothetical protein